MAIQQRVDNNTTNVSYNGGAGGTTAQATPQQVTAANQQRVPPTPQQTQHLRVLADRGRAFSWLAERVNAFVNVVRPRIRSAAADYQARGE
jgi:hypothetical protein